jgi:hypothetical protein
MAATEQLVSCVDWHWTQNQSRELLIFRTYFSNTFVTNISRGTRYDTNQKVAGSIPDEVNF